MTQANPLFPVKDLFPKLQNDLRTDILVVGAGMAGMSCAYHLAAAGYDVAVLEEQEPGSGATGASSGILYYGTGTDLTRAIELFGTGKARMLWEESRKTIERIVDLAEKNSIPCNLRKPGALMVAQNQQEKNFLEEELNHLKGLGFEGEMLEPDDIKNHFTPKEFTAGLSQDSVVQILPALFIAGLAQAFNLPVYANSPLINYRENPDGIVVETPKAKVYAHKIIFATNRKPFFGLENHFFVENSVILASPKLTPGQIQTIWPDHRIIWTVEEKYDILYAHDSRAILELYYFKGAKDKLKSYYPSLNFVPEYTWGDSWSKTSDWLPIVGPIQENIFAAVAMGDQGIVMGFTAGRKIVDLVNGRKDEFLEAVSPKRFG